MADFFAFKANKVEPIDAFIYLFPVEILASLYESPAVLHSFFLSCVVQPRR
jgi:hypothetical protein